MNTDQKGKYKLSIFADEMIVYTINLKELKKTLELTSKFSKGTEYKIYTFFLHTILAMNI